MKNPLKITTPPVQPIRFTTALDSDDANTLYEVLISLVDPTELNPKLAGTNNLQIIINMPLSGSLPQNANVILFIK